MTAIKSLRLILHGKSAGSLELRNAVAGLRGLVALLPEGPYWEALAYFIVVVVGVALIAILVKLGPKSEPKEAPAMTGGPQ